MRIMGLDIGTKNIGVAVSDETHAIAQGIGRVRRTSDVHAAERINLMSREYNVKRIIVGFPVNMNGTIGERARDCQKFAELLKQKMGLPVILWDERLSTREAERVMIKADVSRKKRKKTIDKLAAQIILQNYLDSEEAKNRRK